MQQLAISHSPAPVRVESAVCRGLGRQAATHLVAISSLVTRGPGEVVFCEGDDAECVYEVVSGTLRLYKLLPDGRRQITGFVGTGHFLGLAVSDTYAFSAEAIERVRYCRFHRAKLRELLDDFPLMEKRLLEVAANELVAAQEQMLLLGRKTARERVASFMLLQSRQGMPCGHSRRQFSLPMTRNDIADYLGLTIETVSRTLTRLRSDGLIDFASQTEVMISNQRGLEELAGGLR